MHKSRLTALAGMLTLTTLALLAGPAAAYNVFPLGAGQALKWGDNNVGTPGGTIYWSFMPNGTPGSAYCGTECTGTSTTMLNLYSDPVNGLGLASVDLTTTLLPYVQSAFNTWAAAANVNFVYLPSDSGVAINDPGAVPTDTGQIRIGAFSGGSGGAVGYAAPPNGGTGAGDIIFNASTYYQIAPGAEGDAITTTYAPNDFEGLMLHELGHALGMEHSGDASAVMCGYNAVDNPTTSCDYSHINRALAADDIAGIQYLYGAAAVPVPASAWLLGSGMLGLLSLVRKSKAA